MLYYLRLTRPEDHDVIIVGPFAPIEDVIHALFPALTMTSAGMDAFGIDTEGAQLLYKFSSLTAPLDSDPSKTIMIELIRMKNAAMVARLPLGPTWNVFVAQHFQPGTWAEVEARAAANEAPLEKNGVLGCFATFEEARDCTVRFLQSKEREFEGGRAILPATQHPEYFSGHIVVGDIDHDKGPENFKLSVHVEKRIYPDFPPDDLLRDEFLPDI